MKTKNKSVIGIKGTHIHNCDPGECKAKEVVNQINRIAQDSTLTVANANEISKFCDVRALQVAIPKKDNLLRAVSQERQKEMCFQIIVSSDQHFDIHDKFAPFLLHNSGKDDDE